MARQEVQRDGALVRRTTKEADLLRDLVERPGRPVPRDDLPRDVWGYRGGSVHGTGYRFEPRRTLTR